MAADGIVLVGLSCTGKSTVGRALGARLGRPVVNLDDLITETAGSTPATLIRERGEPAFRVLEGEAIARATEDHGVIIATGGGAVIDPLNRWALWQAGTVIWLDAPDDVLLARLAADPEDRPLLADDPVRRLAELRHTRFPYYRAADIRVDAASPVETVVDSICASMGRPPERSRRLYDGELRRHHSMGPALARIVFGLGFDARTIDDIIGPTSSGEPVVVADRRAAKAQPALMAALPSERSIGVTGGERRKRLRYLERLLETASAFGAERGDAWLAVGGGTVTDLVGTAAALYLRGVNFVAVPTTWLGMTDGAVGGKVAVDLSHAKNAAGAFWPPSAVIGDVTTLDSLPRARRLDGMAESLKSGIIADPVLWHLIETRGSSALLDDEAARYAIIDRSVQLKLGVVDRDPMEQGERRKLNLGHTIGHALEVESGYRLPHGQAVVLGLRAVTAIARGRGAEPRLAQRIDDVVHGLGYRLERRFDPEAVKAALRSDKKRHRGRQRWILPMDVGQVMEVDDVTEMELQRGLAVISTDAPLAAAAA
ncbi:MAG: bifunctional shikimate kinase/3-dehydroquinate synthase [Candidatus Limnocylindrales bacterium]